MVLAPDPVQRTLYAEAIEPNLVDGDALFFGHGFNIRFGYIKPPAGVDVVHGRAEGPGPPGAPGVRRRPRRPGARRRRAGRDRHGVAARAVLREGASAACAPAASRRRSPRRPRPTCSASRPCSAAARRRSCRPGSRSLIEAGYQPEVAYFECLHELKLIVDLMYEGGIAKQRWSVSDTAEYGDYVVRPAGHRRPRQGQHAGGARRHPERRVRRSASSPTRTPARPEFKALRAEGEEHPIEETGRELRGLMAWVESDDDYVEGTAAR